MRMHHLPAITDGTAQDARFAPALGEHYFDVEERSFEEILAGAAEFAQSIPYYNAQNKRQGSWKDFFARDEAIVMAEIVSNDASRMEAEFLPLLENQTRAAGYLVRFALRIDRWRRRLLEGKEESTRQVSREIEVVIDRKLRTAMQAAAAYLSPVGESPETGAPDGGILTEFDPLWGFQGHPPAESGAPAETVLRASFYSLVSALSYLQPIAAGRLSASLKSGNHDPGIALFLSFVRLLGKAQEKVNRFTGRHRDFYYDDVLRMQAKPPIPDSTFLVLEPAPGITSLTVPKGTDFAAGKSTDKVDLIYATDAELTVTDARIRSLLTLHAPRDPQISPEHELGFVDGLRSADVIAQTSGQVPGGPALSWPLFGANSPGTAMSLGQDAPAGFAVASSALRLREGDRHVNLTVSFRLPHTGSEFAALSFGEKFRRLVLGYPRLTKEEKEAFTKEATALGVGA